RWEVSEGNTSFVFHLRRSARWSDGGPITAHDFVYTVRRGLTPALASRSAYMAYEIQYAQAYNEGAAFARDPRSGTFVTLPADPSRRVVVPSDPRARAQLTPDVEARLTGTTLVPVR